MVPRIVCPSVLFSKPFALCGDLYTLYGLSCFLVFPGSDNVMAGASRLKGKAGDNAMNGAKRCSMIGSVPIWFYTANSFSSGSFAR